MNLYHPCKKTRRRRIAELERKLDDTVELLHLWKGEAGSYRWLAQRLVSGDITIEQAKRMLERSEPKSTTRVRE